MFSAGVHYNDWKGTIAADNADHLSGFHELLRGRGVLSQGEALVGIRFHSFPKKERVDITVTAIICAASGFDNAKAYIESSDELEFEERDVSLSLNEFFCLFKEFEFVLTQKGLELDGRQYKKS